MSAPKAPQACKQLFTSPPSVNSLRVKSYGFYALNSVTLQQHSIGMADPWRTLNRLARAIGDRALAGNAVLRRPTARPGPDPPPYQMEVAAVVAALCSRCVLWSLGQTSAGPPHDPAP